MIRVRGKVTELKYVVLYPVYQTIAEPGWWVPARPAASKQQPAPQGPWRGPEQQRSCNRNKNGTTPSGMVFRNFFTLHVLPGRTPRAGKSQNTLISGHFGPWHLEESREQSENGKTQFPGARGPERGGEWYHAIQEGCPRFSYVLHFGRTEPPERENTKCRYFGPFWPRTALGT